jgi:hypothetical protein
MATSRPPSARNLPGVLEVPDVGPVVEGRIHHNPVELGKHVLALTIKGRQCGLYYILQNSKGLGRKRCSKPKGAEG